MQSTLFKKKTRKCPWVALARWPSACFYWWLLISVKSIDLLSSLVLSSRNWAALFMTAYSESVTVKNTTSKMLALFPSLHTHTHSFSSVTVTCYILYPYLHRKHVSKKGQRASTEWFAYAALQSDREATSPLIHSLSKVRTQTHDPVRKCTLHAWYWEICLCFSFLYSPRVWC